MATMSDKLLPVIIFITIYAKSSYSHPNRVKNSSNSEYYNSDKLLISHSQNSVNKIDQSGVSNYFKSLPNHPKLKESAQGRSVQSRGFVDGFLNFITGGLLFSFFEDEKKTQINKRRNKRIRRPQNDYGSEEEYDFDPVENFFDGLDSVFGSKEITKSTDYDEIQDKRPSKVTTESYQDISVSGEDYEVEDYTEDYLQDDSTEYSSEKLPTTNNNYYHDDEDDTYNDSTSLEQTSDEITTSPSTVVTTIKRKLTTTPKPPETESFEETTEQKPTTLFKKPTTSRRKPTTTQMSTTTTSTSTTTSTEKPTTVRIRYSRPSRRTTPRPIRTTTRKPPRIYVSRKPYEKYANYLRPEYNIKSKQSVVIEKHDCNLTTPKAPQTWLSGIFNSDLWSDGDSEVAPSPYSVKTTTTTKSPGGWLDIFGDDDEDEQQEEQVQKPSTGGWFNQIFADDDATTTPLPTIKTTPSSPKLTTTQSSASAWFANLLNAEEDDGAYSQVVNDSQKLKKNLKKTYNGYQLFRVNTKGTTGVKNLMTIQEEMDNPGVTWWSMPSLNRPADVLVSPNMVKEFKEYLDGDEFKYQILIQDLQKAISFENPKLSKTQRLELERQRGHPLTWKRYHRYSDIMRYLEYLSIKYPETVDLIPIGRSTEGLPLIVVKVSHDEPNTLEQNNSKGYNKWMLKSNRKPAVWIDAGMHAREWIAPAVATWFLHALIEGEKGEGMELDLLKLADWYILPVGNPDGYEYSHTKDRLWSKTRSIHPPNDNALQSWLPWSWGEDTNCIGVDLNRNWDFHWGEKGASDNPCSDFYAGPYAFSEPETKMMSSFLMKNRDRFKLYLTLQSYSQMWMLPMTHSGVSFADEVDVMEMGKLAARVVSDISGTKYDVGTTADVFQTTSGTPYDWAKGVAGIKYAYGVKLRDAKGPHGYLLPGSEIIPTAKELWEAIKVMVFNINNTKN